MGLLSLPVEVLQHISGYLSLKDLLAWSQTCHYLRDVLNDNSVWRRFLPQQDVSSLELQQQFVQPTLQPEHMISPLCDNKIRFMRKTRLLNNWRNGKYTIDTMELSSDEQVKRSLITNTGQFFDNNYILFLVDFPFHSIIELWDINKRAALQSSLRVDSLRSLKITGLNLILFSLCEIHVYKLVLEKKILCLKNLLIVNKHISVTDSMCNCCNHKYCPAWTHYIHEQFLLYVTRCELHVWNIEEELEVGTFNVESLLKSSYLDNYIAPLTHVHIASAFGNSILLQVDELEGNLPPRYCVFNLLTKGSIEIKGFKGEIGARIFNNNVLTCAFDHELANHNDEGHHVGRCDIIFTVHDLETAELKQRRITDIARGFDFKAIKVINGTFAVATYKCLQIIDVNTLEVVHKLQLNVPFVLISELVILGSLFAVITTSMEMGILDIEKQKWLFELPYFVIKKSFCLPNSIGDRNRFCINSHYTKMICHEQGKREVAVLSFW